APHARDGAGPAAAAPAAAAQPGVPGLAPIDLGAERIQLGGIRTATVTREALGGTLRATGVVAPSERGLAQINVRFAGWIRSLPVAETGARVRRGQVLATIDSPDVTRAEEELLLSRSWSGAGPQPARARDDLPATPDASGAADLGASARRRLELLGISGAEIDEVLRAGKARDTIGVRSPVDGYVINRTAVAGMAVQPGSVLFDVADLSQVWVTAEVSELDIGRVRVGQKARLELAAFPGEAQLGSVQFIAPVVDTQSRTLRVRLVFKNRFDGSGPRLRPGMYGAVTIDGPAASGLAVPAEALVDTGQAQYVFVARPGGRFEPRAVTVGARRADRVEIKSGLRDGETVVTTGNFLLDSESRLRAAIEGQGGGQTAGAGAR
ncbi:MAG TPA: efflux RND transporter periplasmic adaptor subunit, partial [Polyangia bacterium]|nr:efflux RND transporter periplasmic adaptor subunit [Polyangia bacterium]